mgnify:CR=1 FL=1
MSDYLKAIHDDIRELRSDVKEIANNMPNLATKEQHNRLSKRVDKHGFIFSGIVWVGGIGWAFIKFVWDKLPHG